MNDTRTLPFDLICVGTGPASSTVAMTCAKQGWNVAIVEAREFGGTCALRGCNPKKVFTNAAELVDRVRRAKHRLLRDSDARIEWSDLVAFQHEFTDPVRERTEEKFRKRGIQPIHGPARFESDHLLRAGDALLDAEQIFLGVGARPAPLEISGEELVVTSDDFMELRSLPSHVVFLGGGFISFEFAHAVARAGSKVTIVDRNERPLKSFDPDLVGLLVQASETAGIEILTDTEATSIVRDERGFKATLNSSGRETTIDTGLVVHGGGRVPNLDGMNLEAGHVAYGKRGITVDRHLRSTTNPAVYAAGDCADLGVAMLTTTAGESARIAAANLLAGHETKSSDGSTREPRSVDYGPVPQVVFSVPPLAAVGLSEADARERGFDLDVRYEDLSTKGVVRKHCAPAAGCKLLIDRKTDRLLGAHLLGPYAEEAINFFALAVRSGLTAVDLKATLRAYPTMTDEYCRLL